MGHRHRWRSKEDAPVGSSQRRDGEGWGMYANQEQRGAVGQGWLGRRSQRYRWGWGGG